MKILSCNLALIRNDNFRVQQFIQLLQKEDPDVITIQEAWVTIFGNVEYLVKQLRNLGYYCCSSRRRRFTNSGLLIASKTRILEFHEHYFKNTCGLQRFVSNGILSVRLENVNIMTTHLHAGPLDTSFFNDEKSAKQIQLKQLQEIRVFINEITNDDAVIITGDFNISRDDEHYPTMIEILDIGDSKVTDPTYPTNSPLTNPAFKDQELCIDHVFGKVDCTVIDVDFTDHRVITVDRQ